MEKKRLRSSSLKARDEMSGALRDAKDEAIAGRLTALDEYRKAQRVLLYASYRSEVHTHRLIEQAAADGKEVYLPKVDELNACLTKHRVNGMHDVGEGYKGIPEPTTDVCIKVEDVDLIVVPGAAFDPTGGRIGYGGGYYDKLLPRVKGRKPIVALAYDEQVKDHVPAEPHDVRMDVIVTDKRVIRTGADE